MQYHAYLKVSADHAQLMRVRVVRHICTIARCHSLIVIMLPSMPEAVESAATPRTLAGGDAVPSVSFDVPLGTRAELACPAQSGPCDVTLHSSGLLLHAADSAIPASHPALLLCPRTGSWSGARRAAAPLRAPSSTRAAPSNTTGVRSVATAARGGESRGGRRGAPLPAWGRDAQRRRPEEHDAALALRERVGRVREEAAEEGVAVRRVEGLGAPAGAVSSRRRGHGMTAEI